VLVILVLFVFSGFFVSAAASPNYYTRSIVSTAETITTSYKEYPVPDMIGKSFSVNLSVSSGSCTLYADTIYSDGSTEELSLSTIGTSSVLKSDTTISSSKLVRNIIIRKADTCNSNMIVNSLSFTGRYYNASDTLPIVFANNLDKQVRVESY